MTGYPPSNQRPPSNDLDLSIRYTQPLAIAAPPLLTQNQPKCVIYTLSHHQKTVLFRLSLMLRQVTGYQIYYVGVTMQRGEDSFKAISATIVYLLELVTIYVYFYSTRIGIV